MGQEPAPVGVADAGPLIHLHEIGRLPLLGIFAQLHVPDAVWNEAITTGRVPENQLETSTAVHRHQVAAPYLARWVTPDLSASLQAGEIECLALCRQLNVPLLLTDDLAARDAAKAVGIRPVGSLGIVVRAFHLGRIALPEAEDALDQLYTVSTLFVTRAIVELAVEQLRSPR